MTGVPLRDTLIITRTDIRRVMRPGDYFDAVEQAFRAAAAGTASSPMPMHLSTARGTFHGKGASISLGRHYVAIKVNANFPGNPAALGLPTIQGAILFFDGHTGALLAVVDSIEVTIQRTAAASALAAKLLARAESSTLLVCGCGEQGRAHVDHLRHVLPIERCLLWDRDPARSQSLAAELGAMVADDVEAAARTADVIACCTTSSEPYLDAGMITPRTFIAAVGTDNPLKSEIAPALMAAATVITDVTAQCAEMGDLHHAIRAGLMTEADVDAELAELVSGAKPTRASPDEIIIFDSTGTGFQDVAAVATIYERCSGDPSIQSVTF